jgi:hypothetical protein
MMGRLNHDLKTAFLFIPSRAVARIVKTIAVFDDFCHANDPR